jgi:predicted negative regulator of RcsB-dependent stress response
MADEYLTEQEQIEQLKNWVKQYGLTILAGILMAAAIVTSWNYWERYQNKVLIHASNIYDEMLALRAQNDGNGTVIQANKLLSHYPKTPYAHMAAFILARHAVENKDYPEAMKHLNWVVDHSHSSAIREIAKVRIARISIAQQKPEIALDHLKKMENKSFNGLVDEIKGDAYLMMKDIPKAKESYQLALNALPKEDVPRRPILQMKLDNLATPDAVL